MLVSSNQCFKLVMQEDGNLVLYKQSTGHYTWATETHNTAGARAEMQPDGNFVLYAPNIRALWRTDTVGSNGKILILQDDGNLVIFPDRKLTKGTEIWHSATGGTPCK
jgi:outer membrane protein assembly factor BamB